MTSYFKKYLLKKSYSCTNHSPSRLYDLTKVHEPDFPMCSRVSFILSYTYPLANILDKWFKSRVELRNPHSVPNTTSLVQGIKDVPPLLWILIWLHSTLSLSSRESPSTLPSRTPISFFMNPIFLPRRHVISWIYLLFIGLPTLILLLPRGHWDTHKFPLPPKFSCLNLSMIFLDPPPLHQPTLVILIRCHLSMI